MNAELRAAFLASAYGRAGERLHLTPAGPGVSPDWAAAGQRWAILDRKSTRLNSSHRT